jgi:hypothetical protein
MLGHYEATGRASLVGSLLLGRGAMGVCLGANCLKEPGTQHVIQDSNIEYTSSSKNDSANGIMGYGGALTLVNGSPFEWTLSSQTSYQMDTWKWPNVGAGKDGNSKTTCLYSDTEHRQERQLGSMLSGGRNGLRRTMQVKHTTTLRGLQRSFRYLARNPRIINSPSR